MTDPYREARIAGSARSGPAQTPPRAALPDVHLEIGAALPEAAATCRIPRADRPLVVLDIPGSTLERWSLLLDDQNCSAEDRDLPGGVTSGPGTTLLLRHTAPGSDLPPLADGAND